MRAAVKLLLILDTIRKADFPPPQEFFWETQIPGEKVVDQFLEPVIVEVS